MNIAVQQHLTNYDQARHSLQICATVDEAKDILDKSSALAAYAKQANDHEMAYHQLRINTTK